MNRKLLIVTLFLLLVLPTVSSFCFFGFGDCGTDIILINRGSNEDVNYTWIDTMEFAFERPAKNVDVEIIGAELIISSSSSISSGSPINISTGISKLQLTVLSGADPIGDITINAKKIDRDTGVTTEPYSETLALSGVGDMNMSVEWIGNKTSTNDINLTTTNFDGALKLTQWSFYQNLQEDFNIIRVSVTIETGDTAAAKSFDFNFFKVAGDGDVINIVGFNDVDFAPNGIVRNKVYRLDRACTASDCLINGAVDGIHAAFDQSNIETVEVVIIYEYTRQLQVSGVAGNNVTQLIAGDNITLSPTGGTGDVTISSTGGGGGDYTDANVFTVLQAQVPWQDANVADDITLTNLTQITTRNYSDLQGLPFIPSSSDWDNNFALRGAFDSNVVLDSRYLNINTFIPSTIDWDLNYALARATQNFWNGDQNFANVDINSLHVLLNTIIDGTINSKDITILDATPILVFKDSDSLGAASVGFIEWRDSGGGRAGFLGNNTSGDDGLLWKNEQGGNIGIQTTGAGKFEVFANLDAQDNNITTTGIGTFGDVNTVQDLNVGRNAAVIGILTANIFSGSGASLTNIPAESVLAGTFGAGDYTIESASIPTLTIKSLGNLAGFVQWAGIDFFNSDLSGDGAEITNYIRTFSTDGSGSGGEMRFGFKPTTGTLDFMSLSPRTDGGAVPLFKHLRLPSGTTNPGDLGFSLKFGDAVESSPKIQVYQTGADTDQLGLRLSAHSATGSGTPGELQIRLTGTVTELYLPVQFEADELRDSGGSPFLITNGSQEVTFPNGDVFIGTDSTDDTKLIIEAGTDDDARIGQFESTAEIFGFSQTYDGGLNDYIFRRHDDSLIGVPWLTVLRESGKATFADIVDVKQGLSSDTARVGGVIFTDVTQSVVGATVNETDMMNFTMDANTLGTNGDYLQVHMSGNAGSSPGEDTDIRIYFGGTVILTIDYGSGSPDVGIWTTDFKVFRQGTSDQFIVGYESGDLGSVGTAAFQTTTTIDLNTNITIKATGQKSDTGDIAIQDTMTVSWHPANT